MSQVSRKVRECIILFDFASKYDLNADVRENNLNNPNIVFSAEYKVRVGSVIFLVGVGSLVCWRLWNYWNERDDDPQGDNDPPKVQPPAKISSKKDERTFLAELFQEEFVQDIKQFEGEDPALIQCLLKIGGIFIGKILLKRYFGLEIPAECNTPSYSDYSPASNHSSRINITEPSSRFYQADNSGSINENVCRSTSDSEVEDLPFDNGPIKRNGYHRKARKKFKPMVNVKSTSSSSSVSPYNVPHAAYMGRCSEDINYRPHNNNQPMLEIFDDDKNKRSESYNAHSNALDSPHKVHSNPLPVQNKPGRSRMEKNLREEVMKQKLKHYFANYDSEEDWLNNDGEEPTAEENSIDQPNKSSREQSISNRLVKMRQGGSWRRTSLEPKNIKFSRDKLGTTNHSEVLQSPVGNSRLKRDDSVTSNMSDYAVSECSEFSIDFSLKDESFASNTLSFLIDIEHELDFVKSSVFEIDEEFFRYSSRPNPYLLKTTYTENSYESNSSTAGSSLMEDRVIFDPRTRRNSEASVDYFDKLAQRHSSSNSTAENSLEWDSPQHGWSSIKNSHTKSKHSKSDSFGGLYRSHSQEIPDSLEWDNGYLKKYEEEMERFGSKNGSDWQLFLPDHASLELDMEEELRNTSGSLANFCARNLLELQQNKQANDKQSEVFPVGVASIQMTASVDSAIYSTTGSRSGSISPSSQMLSQSMMSSGIGVSLSELSPEKELLQNNENILSKRRSFNPDSVLPAVKETGETAEVTELKLKSGVLDFYLPENYESEDDGKKLENFVNNNIMGNKFTSKSNKTEAHTSTIKFEAIGRKLDIILYAKSEWTGETPKALTILKGYEEIPKQFGFQYIRKIRGDNYCAIRSVIFQMMSASVPFPNCSQTYTKLMSSINNGNSWIRKYSFANRLPYSEENISNGFSECLGALDKMVLALSSVENKETLLLNRLNSDTNLDAKLCEAVKLMILQAGIELYEETPDDPDYALLSAILFARETSPNPMAFLINHLNCVGNSAGLEQIEMFLFGYALRVTITVVRPSCVNKEDYVCFLPDFHIDEWPRIYLVAEDDRHYNILSS